jgi:hypothetical protein
MGCIIMGITGSVVGVRTAPASGINARRKVPPDEEPPINEQMETVYRCEER